MTSPAAVEHVSTLIDRMEEEGVPEVTASCRDRGMLEVWAQELHERGYKVHTHWTRRTWGVATSVKATFGSHRIVVSHAPEAPPWVPLPSDPGERTLRFNEPPEGKKIDTILLVRQMRPDWSLKDARDCVEGKRPLFEGVGMDTSARVIEYLALVGWSVKVE
jgi:ribosomal protein L7/L12